MKHNSIQFEFSATADNFNLAGEVIATPEPKREKRQDDTREMFEANRKDWLVQYFHNRGWLNCSHKSLERLETEFAAVNNH